MQINPKFKNLIPPLTPEEYKQLEENLLHDGVREPLVTWNDTLIDGHNRFEICSKHNIPYEVVDVIFENEDKAVEWIIRNQFGRRNLTLMQRSELALLLEPLIREEAKKNYIENVGRPKSDKLAQNSAPIKPIETRNELAKIAGVSHDTIEKVKIIKTKGTEEQIQRARQGGKGNSVNAIVNEIKSADVEMKICTRCGKELPISDFYLGKSICKACRNKHRTDMAPVKNFKGDVIVSAEDRSRFSLEKATEIAKDLYDTEKEIVITSDDLAEDIECVVAYFTRNAERCINQYSITVTEENKQKIIAALSQVETAIEKMKGSFINE